MEMGRIAGKEPFTIFQRPGSTVWWMRFSIRGEGQIRKSLGTSDEADAYRRANKIWHEAQYRKENGLRAVQRTFRAVAEEFCLHIDGLSDRGEVRHDRGDRIRPLVERYFIPFFDKKPIDAITDADAVRYLEWRKTYWTTGPGKDQTHLEYIRGGKKVRRPATDMRRVPSLACFYSAPMAWNLTAVDKRRRRTDRPSSRAFVIHDQPLAFEHDTDPAVAKAAPLARDFTHGNADSTMVWRAFTPDRLGIDTNQHTGPALGNLVTSQHLEHSVSPLA